MQPVAIEVRSHGRARDGALLAAIIALACAPLARPQGARDPENVDARVTPIVQVVRKVGPTVVNLYADLEIEGWRGMQQAGSLGSGVIIHPSGLVVTNAHVITGNQPSARITDLTVSYRPDWSAGGEPTMKKFEARVVGFDRSNDLALLQIVAKGPFAAASLGRSADLMIGETVVAVGNPLGREGSVTHGIVSATHRSLAGPTGDQFDDLIQTDAPLNSGNSGGPLFNVLGELIGINEAIASDRQFGRAEGQGLAIPVDRVRTLLESEFNPYDLLHAWVGLEVENARGGGVLVRKVDRDGPAADAGIVPGDVIGRVGTYDVADRTSFNLSICALDPPDETVRVALTRDGKRKEVDLKPVSIVGYIKERLGSKVGVAASDEERARVVVLYDVKANGPAARLGLRDNDAIVELGGHEVDSVQDVFETLWKTKPGGELPIAVRRYLVRGRSRLFDGKLKL
jgi:S1-C subfamily serine protease